MEIRTREYICGNCGYEGTGFFALECCCYDEYAGYCTAENPGPGCPHGTPVCPVCEDGDYDIMSALKSLRDKIKTKKYMEVTTDG